MQKIKTAQQMEFPLEFMFDSVPFERDRQVFIFTCFINCASVRKTQISISKKKKAHYIQLTRLDIRDVGGRGDGGERGPVSQRCSSGAG